MIALVSSILPASLAFVGVSTNGNASWEQLRDGEPDRVIEGKSVYYYSERYAAIASIRARRRFGRAMVGQRRRGNGHGDDQG